MQTLRVQALYVQGKTEGVEARKKSERDLGGL